MSNIYTVGDAKYSEKMAGFDYDWTLISPKDGKTFPSNIDDWKWLYPNIPEILKKYYEDGFMIVIISNQSKSWKHEQLRQAVSSLNIPLFVIIASEKCDYKPNTNLFNRFLGENKINRDKSFFVGDAIGRISDFSDSDKVFADNIGIPCYCPEQIFHTKQEVFEVPRIPLLDEKQIIIMVGYPGAGKTTIAKHLCYEMKFIHILGDIHKTSKKMIKASLPYIKQNKSIIFDATNSSSKKRNEYIEYGRKYEYKIVCIHVSTSLEVAYRRNRLRNYEKYVPKIAFSVYSKHYEIPNENEGFTLFTI